MALGDFLPRWGGVKDQAWEWGRQKRKEQCGKDKQLTWRLLFHQAEGTGEKRHIQRPDGSHRHERPELSGPCLCLLPSKAEEFRFPSDTVLPSAECQPSLNMCLSGLEAREVAKSLLPLRTCATWHEIVEEEAKSRNVFLSPWPLRTPHGAGDRYGRLQDGTTGLARCGVQALSINCALVWLLLPLDPSAAFPLPRVGEGGWAWRAPSHSSRAESRGVHRRFVAAHLPYKPLGWLLEKLKAWWRMMVADTHCKAGWKLD
ncbi:PREDICTED: uncharacterized protein LOC101366564 [Odobenus rosmarus divergens]|uniref:Uncharacterized protein LOC101366564 n=1 Tax=Odobenus rosmarus divergens TaxID=9708 RepID=A0A9B0GBP6_ODORO